MSQSATPATRNEATRRLKPPKATPFAELAIGTAIRASRGRLRTVANSCGRLRTTRLRNVERTHPQPPDPHSETGTLATHSGKSRWIPKQWPFATIKQLFKIPIFEKKHQAFFPTSPRNPTLEEQGGHLLLNREVLPADKHLKVSEDIFAGMALQGCCYTFKMLSHVQDPHSIIQVRYNGTSSTAQGGGGSFKNRKPIGKVGFCDSRIAERIH